jgi:hypothetical protein
MLLCLQTKSNITIVIQPFHFEPHTEDSALGFNLPVVNVLPTELPYVANLEVSCFNHIMPVQTLY